MDEMGCRRHFAKQQFSGTKCRYGSKADIGGLGPMSVVTPKGTAMATWRAVAKCR